MRSQFCQLTSVLFASLSLVAMAVGLLAFASTALASDPLDLTPASVRCGNCPKTAPCSGAPCTNQGVAYCQNAQGIMPCDQCSCGVVPGGCNCL
jgi:hypothetical protein